MSYSEGVSRMLRFQKASMSSWPVRLLKPSSPQRHLAGVAFCPPYLGQLKDPGPPESEEGLFFWSPALLLMSKGQPSRGNMSVFPEMNTDGLSPMRGINGTPCFFLTKLRREGTWTWLPSSRWMASTSQRRGGPRAAR